MCDAQIKLVNSMLTSYDAYAAELGKVDVNLKEPHSYSNMWHIKHRLSPLLERLMQEIRENYDEIESRGAC